MVERLHGRITRFTAMEREAVASRTHVDVVGIRLPGDFHTERTRIEFFRAFDVGHANGKMSQSPMRYHCCLWLLRPLAFIPGDAPNGIGWRTFATAPVEYLNILKDPAVGKVPHHDRNALVAAGLLP